MIDLQKKVEIVLTKRNALSVRARVGLAVDVSGSMQGLYEAGVVQQVTERFLALAMKLDDDQQLDCWTFDGRATMISAITAGDIDGCIDRRIVRDGSVAKWGGTSYAPPIFAALEHWFPKPGFLSRLLGRPSAPDARPALLIFATDGDNQDATEARAAMAAADPHPIYFAFVGIGRGPFRFIESAADAMPNVGFLAVPDIGRIPDEELYDRLVTQELTDWLKGAQPAVAA